MSNPLKTERSYVAPLPDQALLDAIGTHPTWELSRDSDPPDGEEPQWMVHLRSGPVSDKEWHLIGKGRTVRDAITAAIRRAS